MEAETPVLSPRRERFCRYVSLGHSLSEAARRAGYSPASCRQRGSELYCCKEIQQRVAELTAQEAQLEETRRDSYMRELREIRGHCKQNKQYGTALRALTAEIRLSGVKARWAERRSEKDEEKEAELRARLEAKLRERIEEETRARLETELRARIEAEVRAQMEAERQAVRAEPGLSGTNHVISNEPDVTLAIPTPAEPRAEAVLSGTNHDGSAEPDHIDLLIADINGEPLPRSGGVGRTMTDRDFPGHFRNPRSRTRAGA